VILVDANLLVYAVDSDSPRHRPARRWLEETLSGSSPVGLPWIVLLAIFPLLGFLTGRLFCGWLCPEGALFELADHLTLKLIGRRSIFVKRSNDPEVSGESKLFYVLLTILFIVVLPLLGGVALTGYLVAPKTIWGQIINWDFTFGVKAGIIGVSIYMLVTSLLIRHSFCKYVCAAGLMQMLFGWASPVSLRVRMDMNRAEECTNCRGCEKACFMNVLPRMNKRDISCVNCGACITACNRELGNGKGLFRFQSGEKKTTVHKEKNRCEDPTTSCTRPASPMRS